MATLTSEVDEAEDRSRIIQNFGRRQRKFDVVVVHLGSDQKESSWRSKLRWKKDTRPEWIKDWLPRDAERLGARVIDFRCAVREDDFSNLSYCMDAHSNSLLLHLKRKRGRAGVERPIVFIAQSVGGLVVTSALARAAQSDHIQSAPSRSSIYASTSMVIFLATPHPSTEEGSTEWRDRVVESLTRFGGISKNSLRTRLKVAETDILRLQADCYKSVESRILNVSFDESGSVASRTGKGLKTSSSLPPELIRRLNWKTPPSDPAVEFDADLPRRESRGYRLLLSYVEKNHDADIDERQPLTISTARQPTDHGKQPMSEKDHKRLIRQLEQTSLVAIETLIQLNKRAKLSIKDDHPEQARYLHERICIAIGETWLRSAEPLDSHKFQDLRPLLRDAAQLAGQQGHYKHGIYCLESYLQLHEKARAKFEPDLGQVNLDLGVLYTYNGELERAKKSYRQARLVAQRNGMEQAFKDQIGFNERLTNELLNSTASMKRRTFEVVILSMLVGFLALLAGLKPAGVLESSLAPLKDASVMYRVYAGTKMGRC